MNPVGSGLLLDIPTGDFEVVWAGPNPTGGSGFCFGSEDGRMLLTDDRGRPAGPPVEVAASREAVNGIVVNGDYLAVGTRADVTVWSGVGENVLTRRAVVPAGAHALATTSRGVLVASSGRLGWLLLDPAGGSVTSTGGSPNQLARREYFYQTVVLRDEAGQDVLACAMRQGGVGVARLPDPGRPFQFHTVALPSFDAVDICPLGHGLAVAVAGRDGAIVLSRDAIAGQDAQARNLTLLRGDIYRLACCQGHLVVLTSQALYVLLDVATEFLAAPDALPAPAPVFTLPVKGVDANVAADRYVLVVTDENVVLRVDVQALAAGASAGSLNGAVVPSAGPVTKPQWPIRGVEVTASAFARV